MSEHSLPLRLLLPSGDITRLREYLAGRFRAERQLIADYAFNVQRDPTPQAVLELSARALAFRHELVSWQAFAERLHDEGHAAQMLSVRDQVREEIVADKASRRSVREMEIIVRGQIAPLKQALEVISLTADQMKNVVFWSQAMARLLSSEERLESHTSAAEFDESLFIIPIVGGEAPIDEALRRLETPRATPAGQLMIDAPEPVRSEPEESEVVEEAVESEAEHGVIEWP